MAKCRIHPVAGRAGQTGRPVRCEFEVISRTMLGCGMKPRALMFILLTTFGLDDPTEAQEQLVRIGSVRSTATIATMIAVEKGYFREAGIKAEVVDLDTSTDSLAVVAQNRLQVVGGGLSAAFFNAVEKNFPVIVASN